MHPLTMLLKIAAEAARAAFLDALEADNSCQTSTSIGVTS